MSSEYKFQLGHHQSLSRDFHFHNSPRKKLFSSQFMKLFRIATIFNFHNLKVFSSISFIPCLYLHFEHDERARGNYGKQKKVQNFLSGVALCYAQWIAFKVHLALHVVPHKTSERKIVNCCIFVCSHDDKNFGGRMSFCVAVHFIAQKFLFDFFVLFHVAVKRPPLPTPRDASHGKNGEMNGTFWAFKLKKIL